MKDSKYKKIKILFCGFMKEKFFPIKFKSFEIKILNDFSKRVEIFLNENKSILKFKNLSSLISSKSLMIKSQRKIGKKKNFIYSKFYSLNFVLEKSFEELSADIKKKSFFWRFCHKKENFSKYKKLSYFRVYTYSEKIIQNNIYMVLESIYEPIFEKSKKSFGFRPYKFCNNIIRQLTTFKTHGLYFLIKGILDNSFFKLDLLKLSEILSRLIDDSYFIDLVFQSCKKSIITLNKKKKGFFSVLKGLPRENIISSILFNIYFHEFDMHIDDVMRELVFKYHFLILEENFKLKKYYENKKKMEKLFFIRNKLFRTKLLRSLNPSEKIQLLILNKKISKIINKKYRETIFNFQENQLKYYYSRYGEEWLLFHNASELISYEIIDKLNIYLKSSLYFDLSYNKTLTLNLVKNKVDFLGCSLFSYNENLIKQKTFKKRISFILNHIFISLNEERIYQRLLINNFVSIKNLKPKENSVLIKLSSEKVIQYYNCKILGLYLYYNKLLTLKAKLNKIFYLLYSSAIKTLALKFNSTSGKLFQQFSWKEYGISFFPYKSVRIGIIFKNYSFYNKTTFISFRILTNLRDSHSIFKNMERMFLVKFNEFSMMDNIFFIRNAFIYYNISYNFYLKSYIRNFKFFNTFYSYYTFQRFWINQLKFHIFRLNFQTKTLINYKNKDQILKFKASKIFGDN